MENDVLPINNTATTPGTLRTPRTLKSRKLLFYHFVKIIQIEYSTSTLSVTSLAMLRNTVIQSVMIQMPLPVKRKSVTTQQNGFLNKLTPSLLILTTVRVHVKITPEVVMPARTQRSISTAPSQGFVFIETYSVMGTSTVTMEKMKYLMTATKLT